MPVQGLQLSKWGMECAMPKKEAKHPSKKSEGDRGDRQERRDR
jgi:hypothetical protein